MKIPTFLGIIFLSAAVTLGVVLLVKEKGLTPADIEKITPENPQVVNVTDTSASIVWFTKIPASGQVLYDTQKNLPNNIFSASENKFEPIIEQVKTYLQPDTSKSVSDDRKPEEGKKFTSHFVTLKNLTPDTNYVFQIKSDNLKTEKKVFRTSPNLSNFASLSKEQKNSVVQGVVVDKNFNPLQDAVVLLKIKGAENMAAYLTKDGNFLISLSNVLREDLVSPFTLVENTSGELTITDGKKETKAIIILPLEEPLPTIQEGTAIDFSEYFSNLKKSRENEITLFEFDINHDGKVNSLDVSIIQQNMGKKSKIKEADINRDGSVDQKDMELIKPNLE